MDRVQREARSAEEFGEIFANYYYHADSYCVGPQGGDTRFELATATSGLVPVARFSGYSLGVRRSWKHIRQSPSKLYVIWFPLEGSLSVTQDQANDVVASAGNVVVTFGDRPFHIKAMATDPERRCAQLHVLVPSHVMHSHLPEIDRLCGRVFKADCGGAVVARELFSALFREAGDTDSLTAEKLGMAGLEAIANVLRQQAGGEVQGAEQDARLERILTFIRKNVSVPGLTVEDVARGCNVSRRYIHYLMKHHDKTFSEFLWNCRLEQAHDWLTSAEFANFNIVDIAYMAGFRSASHFSQAYRARYGRPPKEVRKTIAPFVN